MKRVLFLMLAVVLALTTATGIGIAAGGAEDWPMFHHDLALTGISSSQAPDTNAVAWVYQTGAPVEASPVIVGDMVYIGNLAGKFFALNKGTGAMIWSYTVPGTPEIHSTAAVDNGKVFFLAEDGKLYKLDAMTGILAWSEFLGNGSWDFSSPVVHGANVFVATSDGYVHSRNANTGALNWKTSVGGSPNGPVAVVSGKVYSGTHNMGNGSPTLVALNEVTGDVVWSYNYHLTHGGVAGMVNSNGAAVVDGDGDGILEAYVGVYNWGGVGPQAVALNATTGAEKWAVSINGNSTSTPAVHNGVVFIGSDDNKVYALDAATGATKWTFTTGGDVWSAPAVADGKVFVSSLDHWIYAVNEATGALVWSYDTSLSRMISSPAVADGRVFVGNENGKVYAFYPVTVTKELVGQAQISGDGDAIIETGEKWEFKLLITVKNNDATNALTDVVVTDNLGGDLALVESTPSQGSVATTTSGKTEKVHLTWTVGIVPAGGSATLILKVQTDTNPAGKQEYTSAGTYYLNSGATAKGMFLGEQVSSSSLPVSVEVALVD